MVSIDLTGQTAIVIGAGRGIGESIALKLAEAGADVMVSDIVRDNAQKVADKIIAMGRDSKAYAIDVSKQADVDGMVDDVAENYGKVDIMVNNAGINVIKLFEDSTAEEFDRIIDVNLKGVFYGCKAASKYMIKQKSGKIVNTASMAAKMVAEYHTMYSATKFGVVGMTQVIARELGKYNINVNSICPGNVRTDMWEKNLDEFKRDYAKGDSVSREDIWQGVIEDIPLQRPQEPEDMANAVLFLVSDLAVNITGQALNINGGAACVI